MTSGWGGRGMGLKWKKGYWERVDRGGKMKVRWIGIERGFVRRKGKGG
jgi:hypothetical protein